jgi:hypothetical protein
LLYHSEFSAVTTKISHKARRKKAPPDDNLDIETTNHPSLPNGEESTAISAVMLYTFPGSHSGSEDECGWDGL